MFFFSGILILLCTIGLEVMFLGILALGFLDVISFPQPVSLAVFIMVINATTGGVGIGIVWGLLREEWREIRNRKESA